MKQNMDDVSILGLKRVVGGILILGFWATAGLCFVIGSSQLINQCRPLCFGIGKIGEW